MTTDKTFEIEFTEPAVTLMFGRVEAGERKAGDKKDLQPFIDNGKAKKSVRKTKTEDKK